MKRFDFPLFLFLLALFCILNEVPANLGSWIFFCLIGDLIINPIYKQG